MTSIFSPVLPYKLSNGIFYFEAYGLFNLVTLPFFSFLVTWAWKKSFTEVRLLRQFLLEFSEGELILVGLFSGLLRDLIVILHCFASFEAEIFLLLFLPNAESSMFM